MSMDKAGLLVRAPAAIIAGSVVLTVIISFAGFETKAGHSEGMRILQGADTTINRRIDLLDVLGKENSQHIHHIKAQNDRIICELEAIRRDDTSRLCIK
jgi:hypothetical protein